MVFFISGHRDITEEEFNKHYVETLVDLIDFYDEFGDYTEFVVGDYVGVDEKAQKWLAENLPENEHYRVTVYHMGKEPMNLMSTKFNTKGGFKTDEERDAAMTKHSDEDIAFVRKGKRDSGTAQNIVRRYEF